MTEPTWETLAQKPGFVLRRSGRFLVADLLVPHDVLSTSVRNGGYIQGARYLLNHQSCEGAAHHVRHRLMTEAGLERYHDEVCAEASLPAEATVMMGTAANMNYAALVATDDDGVEVIAIVTAGVEGNATCAGDPATWRETQAGIQKVPAYSGTINTILLISAPLTASALARVVVTMTEGKSAALARLSIPSRQSTDLATGTGTDQYCIAAPTGGTRWLTSASTHVKLGELIGVAVRNATLEALRWQNGLEASYTRGVFHALGRYGLRESTFFEDIAGLLNDADLELLRKNSKSVLFEPLVGAAAYAIAAVLDRVRYGTLPGAIARDAIVQQAATLAASLAGSPDRWPEFRSALHASPPDRRPGPAGPGSPGPVGPGNLGEAKDVVLAAIALGWREKWR
jgi:adenosylcobinamide amidohydrolase